jgi:hypothetical protein
MSLVVAAIYVAVLFGVGMSFVYRHRAVGAPKNEGERKPVANQGSDPAEKDRRQTAMASTS